MRFTALSLEKYGAFDQRELTLGGGAGLSVIFGPNEAGKSTLLAAVSDFMFGIHPQTPLGSIYGYDKMRIGATLRLKDGSELALRRKKGRVGTLSDAAGRAIDDATLAHVLGGTGRERFEMLFGLNHETLREGGSSLLAAEGEIGQLIVEAGGGLRTLIGRVTELDTRIDSLFAKRRSADRAFYKASDAVETADAAVKSGQLTREAFAQAETELAAAEEAYQTVVTVRRELATRKTSLERLKRVGSLIRTLQRDEAALTAFEDLPPLPSDFNSRVDRAINEDSSARKSAADAVQRHDSLKSRLEAIVVDDRWFLLKSKIEEAVRTAVIVQKAREDRPNRLTDLAESEFQLTKLGQLISVPDVEEMERRKPRAAVLDDLLGLRSEAVERRNALSAKRQRLSELGGEIEIIQGRIDAAQKNGFDVALGIDAAGFSSLARDASRLQAERKKVEDQSAKLETGAKALGVESVAALELLSVPDIGAIQAVVTILGGHRAQCEREADRARAADNTLKAAEREIERLQRSGDVPTEVAISQARVDRETALAPIRHAHLEGRYAESREIREREAGNLDQAIAKVDGLVDRRSAESQRVAALEHQQKLHEESRAEKARADGEIKRLGGAVETEQTAFSTRWPEATALYSDTERLKGFVEARQKLLGDASEAHRDQATLDGDQADLDVRLTSLSHVETKLGLTVEAESSLTVRVQNVTGRVQRHDTGYGDYVRDERDLETKCAEKKRIDRDVAGLEEAETNWLTQWGPAIVAIGLEPGASLERAESVVLEWRTAMGVFRDLEQSRRRLSRIAEDETAFADLVDGLKSDLDLTLHEDTVVAASQIQQLAGDNESARVRRQGLQPQVADAAEALRLADLAVAGAERTLVELRLLASVAHDDGLQTIAARSSERDQLVATANQGRTAISTAGDGYSVEELVVALADSDPGSLAAELAELSANETKLEQDLRAAIEANQNARSALATFDTAKGIEGALAAREGAATDLRNVVEEWLELSLARDLLNEAIASVRAEQQDPLVRHSGELFSVTTRNAFVGVSTDVDSKGQPVVVGVRADGSQAGVSELSDGTRDQLFLSFRLASLERYADVAEPLPFVADDILVHFDDERTEATLELLAKFGEKNQVLLFTHHASVRDAAKRLSERANVEVLELTA